MRPGLTLRRVLALSFILIAIVPLAVAGAAWLRIYSNTIESRISAKNLQVAGAVSAELQGFIDESVGILTLVNRRATYQRKTGKTPPPDEFLYLVQGSFDIFEEIRLVDHSGMIRHVAPPAPKLLNSDMSEQPFFKDAQATGNIFFTDVFVPTKKGVPTVAVISPGKNFVAVGYLSLAKMRRFVNKVAVERESSIAICDRQGRIIARSDGRLVDEDVKNIEPVKRAIKGETGTFHYQWQGQGRIGSTAVVGKTGWIVLVCQPEAYALAPLVKMRNILMAVIMAAVLVSLLLAVIILRRPLRSIASLVKNADRIAKGDYHFEDVPPSYPEINLLAESMAGMAKDVLSRENALIKTEKKYKSLVEESFDGIFLHDGKVVIFANRRLCEMFGYEEKEIIGVEFTSLLSPEYREIAVERTRARFEGKEVIRRYDVKMVRRDGSVFDVEVSAGKVVVDGQPAIQVWVRDVSEQKLLKKEWALSERRFRELYDSVSDLIYTQDLEGRFLSVNRAMASLFDLTPSEMVGLKASAFMKPELVEQFKTEYLATLKKTGHHEGTSCYYSGQNTKFYIEYRSVLVTPPDGDAYISGVGRDVTDNILTRRKIDEDTDRLRAILDTSPNPIVAYDTEGKVVLLNRAFTDLFGWTMEELNGKSVHYVPEEEKERTMQPIRDLYAGKMSGVINLETVRLTKSGERRDIYVSAALIFSPGGKAVGMVVSLMDVTERKKLENALQQASKMEAIGSLAGGIAHDFNNLLMGIQGNVSIAMINRELNDAVYKNLENIESLVNRGATLTRQLLGFARGGRYEVKTYDICDILDTEAELFGDTKKEITIARKRTPDIWKVSVDRSQIEQVFMNLFVNAGQAMPKGGTLSLGAENVVIDDTDRYLFDVSPGRYVKVTVTDTGTGMDENTKKRIFEPFFTTKGPGKGTGLGLASVYGIIKNHGGFIKVYSEVGRGSSFHVYLPASGSEIAEKKRSPVKEELYRGEGTILLVDDETMIRDVAKEMLEALGYTVIAAGSGREAIGKYTDVQSKTGEVERFDLVIQDMIMPGMGGGEVFDRLKEIDPDVKVLLASGFSIDGQAREILSRGCKGFIQKPFTMEELSRMVREVMGDGV